jgi:protein associated with RNAse G/E
MELPQPPRNQRAEPGARILLRATKYDGAAHWIQPFSVIADDGVLITAQYRARTPIYTSRGEFRSPYDSRVYFWRDRWYNVFRLSKPGCALALWYCNVTTPPTFDGCQIGYVDLDLDVSVRPNGCIELLDEDEFEEHQRKYGYPEDVIRNAEAAAIEVAGLARGRRFPFDQG